MIDELEKNEAIDKKLLRYLTARVKILILNKFFLKKMKMKKKKTLKVNHA